jgi:hypothetical protein
MRITSLRRSRSQQAAPVAEPLPSEPPTREPVPVTHLADHVVLVGYGASAVSSARR